MRYRAKPPNLNYVDQGKLPEPTVMYVCMYVCIYIYVSNIQLLLPNVQEFLNLQVSPLV